MNKMQNIVRAWLPLAVVSAGLCFLVYVAVQQSLRMSANDPQIQMSEDGAAAMAGGATADSVVPPGKVDVGRSLAPFMIVYDTNGKILASSVLLYDQVPELPSGVLEGVRTHGQLRETWAPEPAVRIASVVTAVDGGKGGFVLAGRSLREVEVREDQALMLAGLTLLGAWISLLVLIVLGEIIIPGKKKANDEQVR